jgi:hypothetical protein
MEKVVSFAEHSAGLEECARPVFNARFSTDGPPPDPPGLYDYQMPNQSAAL